MEIEELKNVYRRFLGCGDFWKSVRDKIDEEPEIHLKSNRFLPSSRVKTTIKHQAEEQLPNDVKESEIRIDVPVWFGDLKDAEKRIIIYGTEPRDTNQQFDINDDDPKRRFSTPFGVHAWNKNTSIKGKTHLKYFESLMGLLDDGFILLSDIVKFYLVLGKGNNEKNDAHAGKHFNRYARHDFSVGLIKKELEIVKPTYVILLGTKSCSYFLKTYARQICEYNILVFSTTHPAAYGGAKEVREQLHNLIPWLQPGNEKKQQKPVK